MNDRFVAFLLIFLISSLAGADIRELVPEDVLKQIAEETSGEAAKRNLDTLSLQHRMRASDQFDAATQHILERLRHYGLDEVGTLDYKADGKTMFGTQKSRPVWDVRFAQLWEVVDEGGEMRRVRKFGDWDSVPLTLAQDSLSAEVTTSLIDIAAGTAKTDYAGKDVRGKLVLTSSQPGAVVERAVGELGAVGIISYAPNQKSAWWKEDDRLIRWGHFSSFPETESFGFMISLGEARLLQRRLGDGETIQFHAKVGARHQRGKFSFATAAIKGTDKRDEEINLTCHLDHPRPGANDNASGCVSILETARTLSALIKDGILPPPSRTIRFLWPAEIEGSLMYLTQHDDPSRIKANIHMDMVGGAPVTKAVFRISGGPISVPSFIGDLGHEIGHFVNDQSKRHADGEDVEFPLTALEGGKEPQLALMEGLDMGSDQGKLWPAEIEGSLMYLTQHDDPSRIKANIHMDMVGGAPVTKAVFRISGGPISVPSFIGDLGHEIGHFVNDQSKRHADGEDVEFPLTALEGGKEPQLALMEGLDMGSDHDVFFEGSWRIPGLYLHDWPDRYIHTNYDLAANIDPTKLKRAAFIGAVSAWYLANMSDDDVPGVLEMLERNALRRSAELLERRAALTSSDAAAVTNIHFTLERRKVHSVEPFANMTERDHKGTVDFLNKLQALLTSQNMVQDLSADEARDNTIYERNSDIQGPMHAFGYSYIEDKLGVEEAAGLRLSGYSTSYGGGGMFTYEALNFVDGTRTVSDIRDWLVAELGPVPTKYVAEYLLALESIDVIRKK